MSYRFLAFACVFAPALVLFPADGSAQPSGGPYGPSARTYDEAGRRARSGPRAEQ